ncbi:hypothetical protein [Erwinia rhapontici]|uniref:hypothetical protein n=1 Tax=Erwinia rhapontici TaxID=55212 RepID=UPI00133171A7|nr:hypothetical protein [Erwinia rhapontici]MBP2156918.1 hypothetical protein [Erwinia rhapontici]
MEKYYVSGCKDNGSETVTCDDSEAQFWTLYVRDEAGLSQGIIDLAFRDDAEAAMAVYVERDALQEQVRALATEVSECRRFVAEELGPESGIQFAALSTERSDEVLREIRAQELDDVAGELSALDTVGSTGAIAHLIWQKAARIRSGDQP